MLLPWIFSWQFTPEQLGTAAFALPLIKLLLFTKSKFSAIFSHTFFIIPYQLKKRYKVTKFLIGV